MHHFLGHVVSGRGRGKRLTVPTVNLVVEGSAVESGVYAVFAGADHYPAVMHVGPRPTFEDDFSVEVHYLQLPVVFPAMGEAVEVRVVGRLREVQRFDSPEALKKQIEKDMMAATSLLSAHDPSA